jgi:hypothetical protein
MFAWMKFVTAPASCQQPRGQTDGKPSDRPHQALTVLQIVAWAEAYHVAHGIWPDLGRNKLSGPVPGAPGESWRGIDAALAMGTRGLPGHSSLAELLSEHRAAALRRMESQSQDTKIETRERELLPAGSVWPMGYRVRPPFRVDHVLAWADAYHAATGRWPNRDTGPVLSVPFRLSWATVDDWLKRGRRGFRGGTTLFRVLATHRGASRGLTLQSLSVGKILAWADAHHAATGAWPRPESGPVYGGPARLTWRHIDSALSRGRHGLPGGSTLRHLLAERRRESGRRPRKRLTVEQVLAWADAHHAATGAWPTTRSGPIAGAPVPTTWNAIDQALRLGGCGLPGPSSLRRLLLEERRAENSRSSRGGKNRCVSRTRRVNGFKSQRN